MSQANNVIMIVGRVGSDPEVKYIDANKVVARFNVAVNRPTKDSEGNYIIDWFPCEFWGKQAEVTGEYVKKGSLLSVVGSAKIEKWETNGEKKSRFVVNGQNLQLLSSKSDAQGSVSYSPQSASKPIAKPHDFADIYDDIPPF